MMVNAITTMPPRTERTSQPASVRAAVAVLLSLIALGCQCEEPDAEAHESTPPETRQVRRLPSSPFDLIVTAGGALLVHVSPEGALVATRLSESGDIVGRSTVEAHPGTVTQLVAASDGDRAAVAWIAGDRALASRTLRRGEDWTTPRELGTVGGEGPGRIGLDRSVAGGFVAHHQTAARPCTLSEGPCVHVRRTSLGAPSTPPADRDFLLEEIDRPCQPLLLGTRHHRGSQFHALCHDESTLVFVLDPDPALATPVTLEPACSLRAMVPVDDGMGFIQRCAEGTRLTVLDERGDVLIRRARTTPNIGCRAGRAHVELGGAHGLTLSGATDHLGGVSDAPDDRIVWTGRAWLTVTSNGDALALTRERCASGQRIPF